MKTLRIIALVCTLTIAALAVGCVVHDHSASCGHHYYGGRWYYTPHHLHGPGCGHVLRGSVWITVH